MNIKGISQKVGEDRAVFVGGVDERPDLVVCYFFSKEGEMSSLVLSQEAAQALLGLLYGYFDMSPTEFKNPFEGINLPNATDEFRRFQNGEFKQNNKTHWRLVVDKYELDKSDP